MLLACLGQNTVLTTLDLEGTVLSCTLCTILWSQALVDQTFSECSADNPCSEEAPGTMEEIDAALNRNRMLSQSPCPGTPTPGRQVIPQHLHSSPT